MNKNPKGSPGWRHRLSNIDEDNRTAICQECGLVPIQKRGYDRKGNIQWRCRKAATERSRLWKRRKRQERNLVLIKHCEVCGTVENLCYDHNHENNQFRGTLCKKCNLGIGLMNEDIGQLKQAIKYLRRTNAKGN